MDKWRSGSESADWPKLARTILGGYVQLRVGLSSVIWHEQSPHTRQWQRGIWGKSDFVVGRHACAPRMPHRRLWTVE